MILSSPARADDCPDVATRSLYGVTFVDNLHGWAVGQTGTMLRTDDGGATWTAKHLLAGGDVLMAVSFIDAQNGWAVGFDKGTVLRTQDGGITWQQLTTLPAQLNAVTFRDRLNGWVGGLYRTTSDSYGGRIFATVDGGNTWHQQAQVGNWIQTLQFIDQRTGWASAENTVYATADGGATWHDLLANIDDIAQRDMLTFDFNKGIAFTTIAQGWVAGGGGKIVVTTDGGKTWSRQNTGISENLNSVAFLDQLQGWAVGNVGVIVHTTDGGGAWRVQNRRLGIPTHFTYIGLTSNLESVACTDARHCWAVGSCETILSTVDGARWTIKHQIPASTGTE